MCGREVKCKIILRSEKEITNEDILKLEQMLNGSLAIQIWTNISLGVRYHITVEE